MAGFRKPEIPREQLVLWSQRLDDALPADHPARLIDELFNSAALAPVFEEWTCHYHLLDGQPPYHPRSLATLYCYGLLVRLRSSRQLESACHNHVDVIWLMSGQKPDHSTIAAFVTAHRERVGDLFRQVVRVGIKAGLVKMEHAAGDGTTVEANAGRGSVHKESTIKDMEQQLEKDIEKEVAKMEQEFQDNQRREGLLCVTENADLPESELLRRLKRKQALMNEALAAIKRRQSEKARDDKPDPRPIASTTDPDSRVMKDKEGRRKPNYNAQLVVDAHDGNGKGMIVAAHVSDRPNDSGQMMEMIAGTQETCGRLPGEFSFDAGYNSGRQLAELEDQKITAYVGDQRDPARTPEALDAVRAVSELNAVSAVSEASPVSGGRTLSLAQIAALPRMPKTNFFHHRCFAYNAANDTYTCPAGQTMTASNAGKIRDQDGALDRKRYKTGACGGCVLAAQCCTNPAKGRGIYRLEFEEAKQRMRERMKTDEGKARYKLRGQTVEPRIGTLKSVLGMRKFLRPGIEKVRTEWKWACTALNVGILLRYWGQTKQALR